MAKKVGKRTGKVDGRGVIIAGTSDSLDRIPSPKSENAPKPKDATPQVRGTGRYTVGKKPKKK